MVRGDLAEFVKNSSHIMIFLPHYMWAENNERLASETMKLLITSRSAMGHETF